MGFNSFPTQWELVALILGGVSLLMATQPFTQAIWGAPKISLRFIGAQERVEGLRLLQVSIFNTPITKGVLAFLRVHRNPAEDMWAHCQILRDDTQECIASFIPEIRTYTGMQMAQRAYLPASSQPAHFYVAGVQLDTNQAFIWDDSGTEQQLLPYGLYRIRVQIDIAGRKVAEGGELLVVQAQAPYIYWRGSS